jgi:chromosome segregation ATPase
MEIDGTNVGKMETELKQWGAKLDDLAAKAEETGGEVKAEYRRHIDDLKVKHQAARARLDELKSAGSEKWNIAKNGVESAWSELESAFKKLTKDPQ